MSLPPFVNALDRDGGGSYDTDEEDALIAESRCEPYPVSGRRLSAWALDAGRRRHIVRALRASGYTLKECSNLLGVSTEQVRRDVLSST